MNKGFIYFVWKQIGFYNGNLRNWFYKNDKKYIKIGKPLSALQEFWILRISGKVMWKEWRTINIKTGDDEKCDEMVQFWPRDGREKVIEFF